MKNDKYALIGIHPKTKEVVFLAICNDRLQAYWDDMDADLIPAIVPLDQAREHAFDEITTQALISHIFEVSP